MAGVSEGKIVWEGEGRGGTERGGGPDVGVRNCVDDVVGSGVGDGLYVGSDGKSDV